MTHIDWIISFGVFVILLLTMFILFGPALNKNYDDLYLKTLAEKGIKDATFDFVAKYPVYIETTSGFNELRTYNATLPKELLGIGLEKLSLAKMGNGSFIINSREIIGDQIHFDIAFNDTLTTKKEIFLIYSDYFNLTNIPITGTYVPGDNATFGLPFKHFTFSGNKFTNLTTLDYDAFKEALKYPATKQINVYVYDAYVYNSTGLGLLYYYNKTTPQENDQVYVLTWLDTTMNESGRIERVIVNVRTW